MFKMLRVAKIMQKSMHMHNNATILLRNYNLKILIIGAQ